MTDPRRAVPEVLVIVPAGCAVMVITEIAAHVRILEGGIIAEAGDRHVCRGGEIDRAIRAVQQQEKAR